MHAGGCWAAQPHSRPGRRRRPACATGKAQPLPLPPLSRPAPVNLRSSPGRGAAPWRERGPRRRRLGSGRRRASCAPPRRWPRRGPPAAATWRAGRAGSGRWRPPTPALDAARPRSATSSCSSSSSSPPQYRSLPQSVACLSFQFRSLPRTLGYQHTRLWAGPVPAICCVTCGPASVLSADGISVSELSSAGVPEGSVR